MSQRDDRVLGYTRGLSLFILPFLVAGFVLLYLFPDDTARLWSWPMSPAMSPMVLASAYLGGSWFFLRVQRERRWHAVRAGFPAVALFATMLGIATVVHWDKFSHAKVAFWLWAGLYFLAPFLVIAAWVANQRHAAPVDAEAPQLGSAARIVLGLIAGWALVTGLSMFVTPASWIPHWPWLLTPLTCRVMAAVFCLGSAGLVVVRDARWSSLGLMFEVAILMIGSILLAAIRARDEFFTDRPLTWLLLAGLLVVWSASIYLRSTHRETLHTPTAELL